MSEKVRLGIAIAKTLTVEHTSVLEGPLSVAGPTTCAAPLTAPNLARNVSVALAAVDTPGGVFSWQNPEGVPIIVKRASVSVATPATSACTVSVGTTAASGRTLSANLITGLDVHTAAGSFDNLGSPGASGKTLQTLAAGKWVTGSTASGASAGLVGTAYIEYVRA